MKFKSKPNFPYGINLNGKGLLYIDDETEVKYAEEGELAFSKKGLFKKNTTGNNNDWSEITTEPKIEFPYISSINIGDLCYINNNLAINKPINGMSFVDSSDMLPNSVIDYSLNYYLLENGDLIKKSNGNKVNTNSYNISGFYELNENDVIYCFEYNRKIYIYRNNEYITDTRLRAETIRCIFYNDLYYVTGRDEYNRTYLVTYDPNTYQEEKYIINTETNIETFILNDSGVIKILLNTYNNSNGDNNIHVIKIEDPIVSNFLCHGTGLDACICNNDIIITYNDSNSYTTTRKLDSYINTTDKKNSSNKLVCIDQYYFLFALQQNYCTIYLYSINDGELVYSDVLVSGGVKLNAMGINKELIKLNIDGYVHKDVIIDYNVYLGVVNKINLEKQTIECSVSGQISVAYNDLYVGEVVKIKGKKIGKAVSNNKLLIF